VPYYHVVFTLPHTLNAWVQLHPEVIYGLLFHSVWATLKAFAADPRRLGGELGMSAVLHCLIPGGALGDDGRWRAARSTYLFPVRALSRHIRGTMVAALRKAHTRGELHRVTRPGDIDATLDTLMQTEWIVYSKACLSHTDTVLAYLARYTHRTAISDRRIVGVEGERVRFRCKDTRDGGAHRVMQLEGEEFLRVNAGVIFPRSAEVNFPTLWTRALMGDWPWAGPMERILSLGGCERLRRTAQEPRSRLDPYLSYPLFAVVSRLLTAPPPSFSADHGGALPARRCPA
jgi:hypothetical protein